MNECKWCGDKHGVEQLCQRAQRGMTRRRFLFLGGAAAVGLALQPELLLKPQLEAFTGQFTIHAPSISQLGQQVADAWLKVIGTKPEDNIFIDRHFARLMADELKARINEDPRASRHTTYRRVVAR